MSAWPVSRDRTIFLWALTLASIVIAPAVSDAVPIQGKYGLGIETGDLLGSEVEAALIYGKSEKTAWLFLVNASGSVGDTDISRDLTLPDTLITRSQGHDGFSISIGPGIRKFVRSTEHFSPYFDLTLQAIRSVSTESSVGSPFYFSGYRRSEWGVETGFAIGAEYFFEKWPVSLAAHANIVTARYSRRIEKYSTTGSRNESVDDSFSASGGLGPRLQVRVYF